jgi:hypothetical protein
MYRCRGGLPAGVGDFVRQDRGPREEPMPGGKAGGEYCWDALLSNLANAKNTLEIVVGLVDIQDSHPKRSRRWLEMESYAEKSFYGTGRKGHRRSKPRFKLATTPYYQTVLAHLSVRTNHKSHPRSQMGLPNPVYPNLSHPQGET